MSLFEFDRVIVSDPPRRVASAALGADNVLVAFPAIVESRLQCVPIVGKFIRAAALLKRHAAFSALLSSCRPET